MLNYIWGAMLLLSVSAGLLFGNLEDITNAVISGGKDAVALCVGMAGVVAVWTGIMKIAEEAGLIKALSKILLPVLRLLFPSIPKGHKAYDYISANFAANFMGLGWAATPAGLMAMKELDSLNRHKGSATNDMCMFMIINMSSLQLVSVNLLAYRAQSLSQNPAEIIGPSILATLISTAVGIAAALLLGGVFKRCR